MSEITKTVDALGYRWTFGPNDMAAEFERTSLERRANRYVFSLVKPASQSAAFTLLLSENFYPDILSAIDGIESVSTGEEGKETLKSEDALITELLSYPEKWVELAGLAWKEGRDREIRALHDAAKECNPHWYPAQAEEVATEEELSPEVEAAVMQLEQAERVLVDDEAEHPDSKAAMSAVGKVMKHKESRAKKKD